jgi:indole-3-glycerol phosphate synthase
VSEDFLIRMADASRRRLESAKSHCDESSMRRRAEKREPAPPLKLSPAGFDLIAEIKKRSPSAGALAGEEWSPMAQARHYAVAGAAAISVLTEPEHFSGELADLEQVVEAVPTRPVMRKDFLVAPYQVLEARASGAGGVLLIASMLYAPEMRDMMQLAHELGMFVLVEIFDCENLDNCFVVLEELAPVMNGNGRNHEFGLLVGANCRNLRTLEVDTGRFKKMATRLPDWLPCVAESGLETPRDASDVVGLGYRVALVGAALMGAPDPAVAVADMISAGRKAASG